MFIDIHTHQLNVAKNNVVNYVVGESDFSTESWFSLGIHPWSIHDTEKQFLCLKEMLAKDIANFLFIGECGLDKVQGPELALQEVVFRKQISLSESYQKPLMIHCVRAYNELIQLKKELRPKQAWIVHGFNRKQTIARSLLANEMFLSFGMKFLNSENGQIVLKNTPLSSVFFETDNDSESNIEEVYILASQILEVDLELLKNRIKENLWQIIGWKEQSC